MNRLMLLAVLLISSPALAAPSLADLLKAADEHNVDRRISRAMRERTEAEFRQAWTSLLPTLSATGMWTHNQYSSQFDIGQLAQAFGFPPPPGLEPTVITPTNQLDAILRADLTLIDVSRWARVAAGSSSEDAAIHRDAMMADLVRLQVIGAYYGYAASLAFRESAVKSLGAAEALYSTISARASVGQVTELEKLRAQAEVERNRQVIADSEVGVARSRRALETLTGMDPGDSIELPEPDTRPEPGLTELEKNLTTLPVVLAGDKDAEAASRLAFAARLFWLPSLGAQFTQRWTNSTGFTPAEACSDDGEVCSSYNTGLTLSWRLDGPTAMGMGVLDAVESASTLGAEKARAAARDQLYNDWNRFNAALTKIAAATAQVQAASRAAQVAKDRFAAGAATQLDVITSERDLFMAEVGHISARAELAAARASVRLSAGQPLP